MGVSRQTILTWCHTGALPAHPKAYGGKASYLISAQAVSWMMSQKASKAESRGKTKAEAVKQKASTQKPHKAHLQTWVQHMQQGGMTGAAFSPRTIEEYVRYAQRFLSRYERLSVENLQATLLRLDAQQFATRDKTYKALVCFGKLLVSLGHLESDFLDRARVLKPKRHLSPRRTVVSEGEVSQLLAQAVSPQDHLLVLLLLHTGGRASEVCAMQWEHIDFKKRTLTIPCGKGGKRRILGLSEALHDALQAATKRQATPYLLTDKNGQQMTRHGLHRRLKRLSQSAKVKATPHALRRAFVTINANKGRPLQMLQRACGHSDIKTTMAYCLTTELEVIAAMQQWD